MDFTALDQGSAVPSMTTSFLNDIQVILPESRILEMFNSTQNILKINVEKKKNQNQKLTELKDLLLSRLARV